MGEFVSFCTGNTTHRPLNAARSCALPHIAVFEQPINCAAFHAFSPPKVIRSGVEKQDKGAKNVQQITAKQETPYLGINAFGCHSPGIGHFQFNSSRTPNIMEIELVNPRAKRDFHRPMLAALFTCVALTACGGGGGSDATAGASPAPAPAVDNATSAPPPPANGVAPTTAEMEAAAARGWSWSSLLKLWESIKAPAPPAPAPSPTPPAPAPTPT
ncbi:MAG TPA: hypothetical protein VLG41_20440, partial [Hydrogenophaga sp.]|nr:hypothetical protein [Hydrogenophaga sp.]